MASSLLKDGIVGTSTTPSTQQPGTLVIGLTGGIASGKSTVSALLVEQGAALVDADQVARDVVAPGSPGLQAVVEAFGSTVRLPTGGLDRKALGAIVFATPAQLKRLEAILHPLIRAQISTQIAAFRAATYPLILLDAALLVEMGLHQHCDRVVVVYCGPELQVARVVARDGLDVAHAEQRLAAQTDDLTRLAVADYAIDNQGSLQELEADVDTLWKRLTTQEAGHDGAT